MAKIRKEEPRVTVSAPEKDIRLSMEQDYDEKFPKFKHVWKSVNSNLDRLKVQNIEPVIDTLGNKVTNRVQMLFRVPKEQWLRKFIQADAVSVQQIKDIRSNYAAGGFEKVRTFADPKEPFDSDDDET